MFRAIVVASLVLAASPVLSDPACDSLMATGPVGPTPELYAFTVRHGRSGAEPPPRWVLLRQSQSIETWAGLAFAVAARSSTVPQALVLKTSWIHHGDPETQAVHLIRERYASPCSTILFGLLPWPNPPTNTNVGIADYVLYHQLAKKSDPDIIQFHVRYPDRDSRCIATDDNDNGNIEQFVFGDESHRHQVHGALVAQITANLLAWGDQAQAAGTQSNSVLEPLLSNYRGFSNLETRIIPRPSGEDLCQIVEPAISEPHAVGVFALNTLREGSKVERLPESVWRITLN